MPDIMGAKDIAFPHLGIYLENVPKSFTIFGFTIALYGVVIGIGMLLGILLAAHIAKKENMNPDVIWDFAIYAVIFAIIGARLYYVAFSWNQYKDNLLSIFYLRQGGLAIYGGVIGGFATLFIYSHIKKINPFKIGDCAVFGLVIGQIVGRWGNFFNREVFGGYTDSLFAMRLPVDAVRASDIKQTHLDGMAAMGDVNFIQVHPTFLYEGVWNLCLLIAMLHRRRNPYRPVIDSGYTDSSITAAWFCDVHRSSDCRYRNKNEIKKETGLACFFLYTVKRKIQLLTISVLSIQKGDC